MRNEPHRSLRDCAATLVRSGTTLLSMRFARSPLPARTGSVGSCEANRDGLKQHKASDSSTRPEKPKTVIHEENQGHCACYLMGAYLCPRVSFQHHNWHQTTELSPCHLYYYLDPIQANEISFDTKRPDLAKLTALRVPKAQIARSCFQMQHQMRRESAAKAQTEPRNQAFHPQLIPTSPEFVPGQQTPPPNPALARSPDSQVENLRHQLLPQSRRNIQSLQLLQAGCLNPPPQVRPGVRNSANPPWTQADDRLATAVSVLRFRQLASPQQTPGQFPGEAYAIQSGGQ